MGRLVRTLLFGISATDPTVLAVSAAALLFIALLSGFAPALKAASVDPVAALRVE